MSKKKKYYMSIDILRVLCCFFVLLYHLNILKGGFLAVCTFFVLTGYFSSLSLFNKGKFSFREYYINRIKKIYVPLLVVVFITILVVSFFKNILWINLKPETLSVLLGYNNIWQISVNQDYFARHINSPFIHFWYIGILLQFDLIYPFIFLILKEIGDKSKKIVIALLSCVSIFSTLYFIYSCYNSNIIEVYYGTFSRIFSLMYGVHLSFIHHYYKNHAFDWQKKNKDLFFYGYLTLFILLCFFAKSNSSFFPIFMIFTSLISIRLIEYGTLYRKNKNCKFYKIIKYISNISYEIYLVQFPIIFIISEYDFNFVTKTILVIVFTILLATIINWILNFKFKKSDFKIRKNKMRFINIFKLICLVILCCITSFGFYLFLISKDYTNEMKKLEEELNSNAKLMEERKEAYMAKLKDEDDKWFEVLNELEKGEDNITSVVSNLSVVGIGDSVMLGAINELYSKFNNGYFDAKISRTDWEANSILQNLKNNNMLGNVVIFNLGSNGACSRECREEIIATCEGRDIFWVNVTNDYSVNVNWIYNELANTYFNFHVIDWNGYSANHPEYFIADGIHLTEMGRNAYTECIYQSIYDVYLERYKTEKNKILDEHENKEKSKYSFYGNDLLLNVYDDIHEDELPIKYDIDKDFDLKKLLSKLKLDIEQGTLAYNIVFVFDKSFLVNESEINSLVDLCVGHNVYLISDNDLTNSYLNKYNNFEIINLNNEINNFDNYLLADEIHLNEEGNNKLASIIKDVIFKR